MLDKGYVIVEKIPNRCCECTFGLCSEHYITGACVANGFRVVQGNSDIKPDWCPIKELPKEKHYSVFDSDYYEGWNECLKSIKNE